MINESPAAYLVALPLPLQARLVELVRGVAGLSVEEKDKASALLLETAKQILAEDPDSPVVLPFGLLVQVVQEIWARSIFPKPGPVESAVQ